MLNIVVDCALFINSVDSFLFWYGWVLVDWIMFWFPLFVVYLFVVRLLFGLLCVVCLIVVVAEGLLVVVCFFIVWFAWYCLLGLIVLA